MATKAKAEEPKEEQETSPMYEGVRKLVLASIGAVAMAQEEIELLINKLVERGELAEREGKKLLNELKEKRKKKTAKAEKEINKQVEELMTSMNVPTKDDIDALGQKINDLDKKVDELKKAQG
ncbi:MAG: phasin family protein [Anaerolineales bacterium]|jgi:poly(hydroxyalkanoate) granule-associated protein|nr:phasin family protein [Anaerolineales bacterium]